MLHFYFISEEKWIFYKNSQTTTISYITHKALIKEQHATTIFIYFS